MKKLVSWLAAILILVIIFGTIYAVVQQAQRADANYPQIQIAQDAASALNRGAQPSALVSGRVDIGSSLAPFMIIYSSTGRVVAGSGYLNGSVPTIPFGILNSAKGRPYSAITWQPQKDVRIATVSVAAQDYYVVSGRSLTEVEHNESRTFQLAVLGGLISIVVLGLAYAITRKYS